MNHSFSFSQEYGLGFYGSEASKDKRTKLDLNPGSYYTFHGEFELSFSMRLRATESSFFGYVARIIDEENNNIDIIYNEPASHSLQIIYGQELTGISVPDNSPEIFENWTEIRLKIDLRNRSIQFSTPDTTLADSGINFKGKVKILFGANNFGSFKTKDVPAMEIKDIRIFQKGKCKHHFPLDNTAGNYANDLLSSKKSYVQFPIWTKTRYHDWLKSRSRTLKGFAAITYDPGEEKVYLVGEDQLKIYSVVEDTIISHPYSVTFSDLEPGSKIFYDSIGNTLFCYNLKIRTVHEFNFESLSWKEISQGPGINVAQEGRTPLWFHNKYYSCADSTLYIIGGYGQHKYYNLVQQYDLKSKQWDTLQTTGDIFYPRYHAALGNYHDTLYILGGNGSMAGDQILKPQHYTDLMAFSLKDRKFIKKYEFEAPLQDMDFAHSMVMDMDDRSYYVLASTIFEYESYLQLLKGSLEDAELLLIGNKIPYLFHDENSYSDLYFSKSARKLIAATFLADPARNETDINIYTISFPPHLTEIEDIPVNAPLQKIVRLVLIILSITALIVILALYFRKIKRRKSRTQQDIGKEKPQPDSPPQITSPAEKRSRPANSILFFGGFQIINKDGHDVTSKFTPLLKELFLLIFLNSVKNKGISVQRLTELLWFSMNERSAKNNRAVNIAKLKNRMAEIDGCNLSRKTGYWQIVFDDSVLYNDYWSCLKFIDQKKNLSREELQQFLGIIKMGPLLGNVSYDWLDEFKAECSNMIIDTLINNVDQNKIESDPDLIIKLADAILIFDILHEEAIGMKCKALTILGKHSLAKKTFAKFTRDYMDLLDEEYQKSYSEIVKHQ